MARTPRFRYVGTVRRALQILTLVAVTAALVLALGYRNARADPIVRRAMVALPDWPGGARPVTVALLSDIHIGNGAMDDARLGRIVEQVNALRPSLVLIAGDFVYGHDPVAGERSAPRLVRPLRNLRAPLGVVAVLGNHDHWTAPAAIRAALSAAGVTVLENQASARGPLAIGGVGDQFTEHADTGRVLARLRGVQGAQVIVSHGPGLLDALPDDRAQLVLVGHTHCGQVVLPLFGSIAVRSPKTGRPLFDPRYICGAVRDPRRLTVVTAGLGASVLPLRFGAPPDLWLLTLGPTTPASPAKRPSSPRPPPAPGTARTPRPR